jgi:hypothetical protein
VGISQAAESSALRRVRRLAPYALASQRGIQWDALSISDQSPTNAALEATAGEDVIVCSLRRSLLEQTAFARSVTRTIEAYNSAGDATRHCLSHDKAIQFGGPSNTYTFGIPYLAFRARTFLVFVCRSDFRSAIRCSPYEGVTLFSHIRKTMSIILVAVFSRR